MLADPHVTDPGPTAPPDVYFSTWALNELIQLDFDRILQLYVRDVPHLV